MADSREELTVVHLGRLPYAEGLELQERLRDAVEAGRAGDTLLLLEHEPAYTVGRRSGEGELVMERSWYAGHGIEVHETDRGGKVTYHGPGQLVGYPVMRVDDVVVHVRRMEQAIIDALADEGIEARSRSSEGPDYTGVWVDDRKIGSIGVHVRRGIATHGFALNVDMEMEPWDWIVPCGLPTRMTSVAEESASSPGIAGLREPVAAAWAGRCGRRLCPLEEERLRELLLTVPAGVA
ncbi:MAG: lipoyl(octanoyl) transferase LipB [Solirubrobacterales bacterium]